MSDGISFTLFDAAYRVGHELKFDESSDAKKRKKSYEVRINTLNATLTLGGRGRVARLILFYDDSFPIACRSYNSRANSIRQALRTQTGAV